MKTQIVNSLNSVSAKLNKHMPDILMAVGIVAGAATVYTAAKETLKVEEIIDETKAQVEEIKNNQNETNEESKLDTEKGKALAKVYISTGVKLAKNYWPAITLGITSVTCILASHGMLKKRNAEIIAVYNALDKSFKLYRARVAEQYGEEVEKRLYFGTRNEKVNTFEVDEDGVVTEDKKKVDILPDDFDLSQISPYARFFDEYNTSWRKSPEANKLFLLSQQKTANDLLNLQGHLFLNEVYDLLGFERTKQGQLVGWVKSKGDEPTSVVDFGIYNPFSTSKREFVNGYEPSILLDFNVQGIIVDKI